MGVWPQGPDLPAVRAARRPWEAKAPRSTHPSETRSKVLLPHVFASLAVEALVQTSVPRLEERLVQFADVLDRRRDHGGGLVARFFDVLVAQHINLARLDLLRAPHELVPWRAPKRCRSSGGEHGAKFTPQPHSSPGPMSCSSDDAVIDLSTALRAPHRERNGATEKSNRIVVDPPRCPPTRESAHCRRPPPTISAISAGPDNRAWGRKKSDMMQRRWKTKRGHFGGRCTCYTGATFIVVASPIVSQAHSPSQQRRLQRNQNEALQALKFPARPRRQAHTKNGKRWTPLRPQP